MNEDLFVDMQYAKPDCKDPHMFATKPWEFCQDPTNTYLGLRVDKRKDFKSKLDSKASKRVEHEVQRIQQTRVNFESYENKKKMIEALKKARNEWRNEVKTKRDEYVKGVLEKQPKFPARWCRDQQLDLDLLERVKSWKVEDEPGHSTVGILVEPSYGFKACAMHFTKSSSGWVGIDHSHNRYSGRFPNQKISVHDLLEGDDANPLSEQYGSDHMRYFHFPTNNMRWIEVRRHIPKALAQDADQMPLESYGSILQRETWRSQ